MKICDKCEKEREEKFFEKETDDLCIYCKSEMEVLDGDILTKENLGEVMSKNFIKQKNI